MKVSSIYFERKDGNGYDYYASFNDDATCHELMKMTAPKNILSTYKSYCVVKEDWLKSSDIKNRNCPKCPYTLSTIPPKECNWNN